jgi:hypothetical protein
MIGCAVCLPTHIGTDVKSEGNSALDPWCSMEAEKPIQSAQSPDPQTIRCDKCGGTAKFSRCRPDAFSRGVEMWTYNCTACGHTMTRTIERE